MPSLSRVVLPVLLGAGFVVGLAAPALAVETSNSQFMIVPEDEVFPEDLYAGSIRVVIDGTLDGDLVAFAAEEVVINGTVTGTVTAVAPSVTINGRVGETLRASGTALTVNGDVGGDLVAAVVGAELSSDSNIDGDVLVWAWDARFLGAVGGDLTGSQRHLDLAGDVDGDVDVSVSRLTLVDSLGVSGDFGYRSGSTAESLDRAEVGGTIVEKSPLPPNLRIRALAMMGRILTVLVLSVTALSIAYGWPRRTALAIGLVGAAPVRRWLVGATILLSPLIVTAVTALILSLAPAEMAFPLLLVLIPVILGLIGMVFALALVAGLPTVGWLGGVLFKRLDLYGSILAGSLLVGVIWYLPIIGWLTALLVLPVGLGAWIASLGQSAIGVGAE
ncbi:MAG: hypothetical protein ACLFWH_11745 [Actinomycetota bacterium]